MVAAPVAPVVAAAPVPVVITPKNFLKELLDFLTKHKNILEDEKKNNANANDNAKIILDEMNKQLQPQAGGGTRLDDHFNKIASGSISYLYSVISQLNNKNKMIVNEFDKYKQESNAEIQKLKSQFIAQTNPVTKEKLKPRLIILNKQEKQAKLALDKAELAFQDMLKTEPDDVVDLLDHELKEHYLRLLIRTKLAESFKK